MPRNPAREETDKLLEELEQRIKKEYEQAAKEIEKKANSYFKRFEKRDSAKQEAVKAGQITQEEYDKWRLTEVMKGDRYTAMLDDISTTAVNADKVAMRMVSDSMPDVFAVNVNYGTFEVERVTGADTEFSLYNRDAVAKLLKDDPKLLPDPRPGSPTARKLAENKDLIWNRQHMNSALTQGILQGNSMDKIAKRLQKVTDMDSRAAIRNARTMTTNAENSGKKHAYHRAADMGIRVRNMWMATHDKRTRESHAMLDGEVRELDEDFSNGLEYPGDPKGEPEEVYNCRCALIAIGPHSHFAEEYRNRHELPDDPSAAWQEWKESKTAKEETTYVVVQGKDISETWERRPDEFKFEIQDVINAQGFDGLPRVVSEDEFNRAVEESNFIAQRTYSAPDQETLDMYRNQLYNGEWYVDCSNGGSVYGQGMYGACNLNGELSDTVKNEMQDYLRLNSRKFGDEGASDETKRDILETYIKNSGLSVEKAEATRIYLTSQSGLGRPSREEVSLVKSVLGNDGMRSLREEANLIKNSFENSRSYIETFTLTKDAKIIEYDNVIKLMQDGREDVGVFAAKLGYDAVYVNSSSYCVILNRTKCIFKGGQ